MIKLDSSVLGNYYNYCVRCIQCGAQSPIMKVSMDLDESLLEYVDERLKYTFSNPRQWDKNFKNPYESELE